MMTDLPISPRLLAFLGAGALVLLLLLLIGKVPLSYLVRNLAVRWKTTLMTALAFTLVVGLLTVMLAFVKGMERLTQSSGQPGNVMVLSDGATDEAFSVLSVENIADLERVPGVLTDERGVPLSSREAYLVVTQPLPAAPGEPQRRRFVQLRGIDDPVLSGRVHNLELYPGGTWFSDAGVRELSAAAGGQGGETAIEAVLGEGVAAALGRDRGQERLDVGDVFELGPRKWIVAGVLRSAGSSYGSEIWAKGNLVVRLFGKEAITTVVLRTSDAAAARAVAQDITTNFRKAALQAQPETEYYAKLSATNQQFLGAIMFVAFIMAIGGVFGIMNTMFAAVSQRTKDIGVLRILGFARWQILVSFFLEALLIALIGGLLGCFLGWLCDGWSATSIVTGGQGQFGKTIVLRLTVDASILATGIVFTLFMGALGGLLPSLSAMRLRPLESLR
jgi:ABC-type lipoprotein release transport system permease subunit